MVSSELPSSTTITRSTTSRGSSAYVIRNVRAALYAGITTTIFCLSGMGVQNELIGKQRLANLPQHVAYTFRESNRSGVLPCGGHNQSDWNGTRLDSGYLPPG